MVLEASSSGNRAPAYSLDSAAGNCNVQYPKLRPQVNQPVLVTSSEELNVIVVALFVSDTGCTCVLTYFASNTMLKRNAEETRQYISASTGVVEVVSVRDSDGFSEHPLTTDGCRICDGLLLTVSIKDLLAARNDIRFNLGTQRAAYGSRSDVSSVGSNDVFPVVARMEASDAATEPPEDNDASTAVSPMHSTSAGGCQSLHNA